MSLPPPHPLFVSSPWPGTTREPGWGGGGVAVGHLLSPVLRLNSLTALTRHICQQPLSYLIGHPSIERTPLSEPQSQRCPRLHDSGALGGGKEGLPRRGEEAWWGGGRGRRENACVVFEIPPLWEKIHRAVTLESCPHFFLNSCNH